MTVARAANELDWRDYDGMLPTAGESILFWLAHIIGYLKSATIMSSVLKNIEVGSFVESMGRRSGSGFAEVIMNICES